MENKNIEDIKAIRSMMEQASRFISLSGWSGVFAGIYALIAAVVAYLLLQSYAIDYFNPTAHQLPGSLAVKLTLLAVITLVLAISTGVFLTVRKSKRKQLTVWNNVTKRLLIHLFIPLVVGGLFCIALYLNGVAVFIPPAMLIFYGLSLLNASKYTFPHIGYLGCSELLLGVLGLFFLGYGFVFWIIGFGILHIVYGLLMERKQQ